jgi:hypothetical protein
MMPGDDVGGLAEPDPRCVRRDGHFAGQWVRTHFRPFRLKMMLGLEPVIETQRIGEDPLPDLVEDRPLGAAMDLLQGSVIAGDPTRRPHGWQVARAVVKYAYLDHLGAGLGIGVS